MCRDQECPFTDVTSYGWIWRKGAGKPGLVHVQETINFKGAHPLILSSEGKANKQLLRLLNCTENLQPTLGTCAQTRCQQQNAHGPTKQCNLITKMCAWFCRIGQNWTFFTNPCQIGISGILGNQNICFPHPVNNDSCIRAMGTLFFCNWKLKWTSLS